jgi:hypothetical protein
MPLRQLVAVVGAVAGEPALWPTAVRQMRRLARRNWWKRAPYLPVPGRDYLAFRLETQYGSTVQGRVSEDVMNYLRWCREMGRLR